MAPNSVIFERKPMNMENTKTVDLIRKKTNITALIMCAAGVLINVLLSTLVSAFGLPLYLDTVGTIAVAVMGGYFPGIAVGFATNMIKGSRIRHPCITECSMFS
jgi:hypothetical protein